MTSAPYAMSPRLKRFAAALMVSSLLASCGSSPPAPRNSVPGLVVVTGLYPLAQAVEQIGQGRARADNVVPPGQNPLSYQPGTAESAALSNSRLVVLGPTGLQPAIDSAAGSSPERVVHVAPPAGGTYYWLDPAAMRKAVPQIAAAMERADPRDAATFQAGARAFGDALGSTGIDYQSTISTCPRRDVFAPDVAFAQTARAYGLTFHVVAGVDQPQASVVRSAAAAIQASGATTVFVEPWVPQTTVRAAAAAAGVEVRALDTLVGPPAGGWPRQATYINLLEANLGALSSGLGCPSQGSGA
ncbi:MAG TPA: metal ABC transporter substrate-binding protein [Acidimicrobiales bacterium]|nr:metal ABC transporter substrate-binding protein [Acidimicrobiales bacterium]